MGRPFYKLNRNQLLQSPDHIEEKLLQGAKKAREYSIPFLNDVRNAVGIQKLGSN